MFGQNPASILDVKLKQLLTDIQWAQKLCDLEVELLAQVS